MDYYNINYFNRQSEDYDYGGKVFVVNGNDLSDSYNDYRRTIWSGSMLQMTLMTILPHNDIGVEVHPNTDQILKVMSGHGVFVYGDSRDNLDHSIPVFKNSMIFIPVNTYHNIINNGDKPLKLISLYAPPQHPFGLIQKEKEEHFHY